MFTKNNKRGAVRPAVITAAIGAVVIGGLIASPLVSLSATPVGIEKNGGARQLAGDQTETLKSQIKNGKAKNVILLIGDGMGDSEITVARDYQYGAAGRFPGIDALPMTGQYTTYSLQKGTTKPDYVPDSAATGTAWSTGTKTYDNAISVDTYGKPQETLLELAKKAGLKTGDVTTSELQDATPAVQVSHISQRSCYGPTTTTMTTMCESEKLENGGLGSITEQLLNTRPDVTLGGGAATFAQTATGGAYAGKTLNEQAIARGYQLVGTKDELAAVTSADQSKPVLGLFAQGNMPVRWGTIPATQTGANQPAQVCPVNPERHTATQPSLSEMTTKAIDLLKNDKGFFLQVEGASIDKQDHVADACGQIGETIDLDEAVQVALEYAKKDGNTTVIVTADHAHTSQIVDSVTPGLSVNLLTTEGSELKVAYGTSPATGSQQHTGTQLRVAGYGPGAANFVGLSDQTDMFFTIRNVLGLEGAQPLAEPTPLATVTASPSPTVTVTATPGALAATSVPTITGSVKVGKTLTATAGTWTVDGLTVAHQWLRDGAVIPGATAATHKVVAADSGTALSVRVTASKTGATAATSFSASTVAVPRVSPKISTAVSGKKLTVKVSGVPSVTGSVSVYRGSAVVARDVSVKGGKATISLAGLDKGKSTLKIVFAGSSQLLPKPVNAKVTVK